MKRAQQLWLVALMSVFTLLLFAVPQAAQAAKPTTELIDIAYLRNPTNPASCSLMIAARGLVDGKPLDPDQLFFRYELIGNGLVRASGTLHNNPATLRLDDCDAFQGLKSVSLRYTAYDGLPSDAGRGNTVTSKVATPQEWRLRAIKNDYTQTILFQRAELAAGKTLDPKDSAKVIAAAQQAASQAQPAAQTGTKPSTGGATSGTGAAGATGGTGATGTNTPAEPAKPTFTVRLRVTTDKTRQLNTGVLYISPYPGAKSYSITKVGEEGTEPIILLADEAERLLQDGKIVWPIPSDTFPNLLGTDRFKVDALGEQIFVLANPKPSILATAISNNGDLVKAPTEFGLVANLGEYMGYVLRYALPLGIILSILMTMWAGFLIIYSNGSPEKNKEAGEIIIGAILGLFILVITHLFVDFLAFPNINDPAVVPPLRVSQLFNRSG